MSPRRSHPHPHAIQTYVSDEVKEWLDRYVELEHRSMASIVRDMLESAYEEDQLVQPEPVEADGAR
jgi:hypothetical protein